MKLNPSDFLSRLPVSHVTGHYNNLLITQTGLDVTPHVLQQEDSAVAQLLKVICTRLSDEAVLSFDGYEIQGGFRTSGPHRLTSLK